MRSETTARIPASRRTITRSGRRRRLRLATAVVVWSMVGVPASAGAAVGAQSAAAAADPAAESGSLRALTYNVAGLPELLSSATTERAASTTAIGARLGPYDLVNVQEDFNYHSYLDAAAGHPYRTPTSGGAGFGSGLNTLSGFPLEGPERASWERCWIGSGDCLTPKRFTFNRIRPADGVSIDVYNLHADAGSEPRDLTARAANLDQLSRFIAARSVGQAVIVMGDTNSRYTRVGDAIAEFAAADGLRDPWVELVRGGDRPATGEPAILCDEAAPTDDCEVVDKVLYRSGDRVDLEATGYRNEHTAFATEDGTPLSDHFPIGVDFAWSCAGACASGHELAPIGSDAVGSAARGGSVG
ncbi:endonuclease [Rhodococcus kronopolitis]|uniref:Endonuclease n=1 Tax=Rhodococcus kronopolitis TaxID=1460226 RepID=A0ABV9FV02_9NOCA